MQNYFKSAAAAVAMTTLAGVAAHADPAVRVGGISSVTNSTVTGDVGAAFVNGSVVSASAVGSNVVSNPYGGFNSLQVSTMPMTFNNGGMAQVQGSTLTGGNVTAVGSISSYLSQSAVGYNATANAVGQVTQSTVTVDSAYDPSVQTETGVAIVDNSSIAAGDVSGTAVLAVKAGDSAIGTASLANGYGGYDRATVALVAPQTSTSGSAFVTDSHLGRGNVTATLAANSEIDSSAVGEYSANRSVGFVGQATTVIGTAAQLGLQ